MRRQPVLNNFAEVEWTDANQRQALRQGWGIFEKDGAHIERYDDARRFDSDAAAVAYCGLRAALGDKLAIKAFQVLGQFWLQD